MVAVKIDEDITGKEFFLLLFVIKMIISLMIKLY